MQKVQRSRGGVDSFPRGISPVNKIFTNHKMSKNTNPRTPERATDAGRSEAGMAREELKRAGKRYLSGRGDAATYARKHRELSAIILAAGKTLPDVPLPPNSSEVPPESPPPVGRGRPAMGRTANLPRIRPEVYALLGPLAERHGSVAAAIEHLIEKAGKSA